MKTKLLLLIIGISSLCNAQIKTTYKTYLDKTLKNYTVYKKPVFIDLNGDKKTDVAVIILDNKKVASLYSIISEGNTFITTNEISNLDKQD